MAFSGDDGDMWALGMITRMGTGKQGKIKREILDPMPLYEAPDDLVVQCQWLTPTNEERTEFELGTGAWGRCSHAYSIEYYIGLPTLEYDDNRQKYTLDGGAAQVAAYDNAISALQPPQ